MSPTTKTIKAHVCSATNPTASPRKFKMARITLPTMEGNASTAFPASLLSVSASLSNHFFKAPLSFGREPPAPPSHSLQKHLWWQGQVLRCSLKRQLILKIWWYLVPWTGYRFFPPWTYLYQELFQWSSWFLRHAFKDPFDFGIVFLALPFFQYSNHLTCLYKTVSVHWYSWGQFLLPPAFWYLFWYVYQFLSV